MIVRTSRPRIGRVCLVLGLLAAVSATLQCQKTRSPLAADFTLPEGNAAVATTASLSATSTSAAPPPAIADMASRDPLGFAEYCLDRCRKSIVDYRCTFTRQETLNGQTGEPQEAQVRFRADPYSVDMLFTKNVRSCARALYVEGQWVDNQGNELAWAKPGGSILQVLVPKIRQPIHGARAAAESRRTIDQFGFERTLGLIVDYCRKAQASGELDLRYVGRSMTDNRPTFVFERRLPYTGEDGDYPDRVLVYHIDEQYLVPTACYAYADDAKQQLLGSYVFSGVQFDRGYTDGDFDPVTINF